MASCVIRLSRNGIGALYSLFWVGLCGKFVLGNLNGQIPFSMIDDFVGLHESRVFGRGEIFADDFPLSASSLCLAFDGQVTFDFDFLHFLARKKALSIYGDAVQRVPVIAPHQAGMSVVGDGAEQRPYHAFVDLELSLTVYSIAQDDGNGLSAHFQMILMRDTLGSLPYNTAVGGDLPACVLFGSQFCSGEQQTGKQ